MSGRARTTSFADGGKQGQNSAFGGMKTISKCTHHWHFQCWCHCHNNQNHPMSDMSQNSHNSSV